MHISIPLKEDPFEETKRVNCQFGWMLIQQMHRFSNFFVTQFWNGYADGFGRSSNKYGNYWFGNKHLHALTSLQRYKLVVVIQKENLKFIKVAEYGNFFVESERMGFNIHVDNYRPPSIEAFDAFNDVSHLGNYQNGRPFSTMDSDNDRKWTHCAKERSAGWWFSGCGSYLNGHDTVYWGKHTKLRTAYMMIIPNYD